MLAHVSWHGTPDEYTTLLRLVDRLCADGRRDGEHCAFGPFDRPLSTYAAHAILREQRVHDGLLWMRLKAARLVRGGARAGRAAAVAAARGPRRRVRLMREAGTARRPGTWVRLRRSQAGTRVPHRPLQGGIAAAGRRTD